MENINALYKALEQADADGNTAVAQQLADQIRTLSTDVTQTPTTKPLVTKPFVPATKEDINVLYQELEQADAAGDTELAQQLADQIRALPTEETPVTTTPPNVKPPVTEAPIDVMGTKFTPEEYAKYSGMPITTKPGEQAKGEFSGNFGVSLYNLAAQLALAQGKVTGNYKEAEETAKRLREYGEKTYTAADTTWKEDPIAKIQQLAGGSAPYMIGPIAAAMASSGIGLTGLAASVAPFLTSTGQFVGSNIERQMGTGKTLEETSLSKALPAAAFQGALDQIGLRYFPFVKNLFKAGGKEITDEAAKQIVQKSLARRVGDKVWDVHKGMWVEGGTEAGQQFVERLQAGLDLTSPQAMQEYFDSFIGGSVLAGSMGVSGTVIEGIANKVIPEQKQKEAEIEAAPDITTEKRPSRETLKRQFLKNAEAKANEINKAKVADINLPTITQAGATADQGKLFNVVGGPSVEVGKPIIVGALDDTTLTSWGLGKNSKAYKKLIGKDVSLPDNRALLDEALEEHPGKINEQAVDTYKSLIEQQETEAPDGRLDLGTTRISDAVLGGQKYGTPSGIAGRYGPTTDISGGITRVDQERETDVNAPLVEETKPLETIKGPEAKAKPETLKTGERLLSIQELVNDPNPQQRRAAIRSLKDYINRLNTNEVIKEGARLEREERAKFVNLKKTQYPIVDQSTNLANILSTLKDKPNYLIEDLRNPNVLEAERGELNQHARDYLLAESLRNKFKKQMTVEERAALEQEGEAVAKAEKALPTEELADVEDQLAQEREEPLEARAREVLETGETPESIETTFQKQYGKNVRLAKQRGLLNFLKDASELPPEIGQVSPTTKAVYYKGKGYFITNRITKEDAPRMLLHEIGVHYGLEGMLGSANYKRIVKQIKQNHLTDKELKAAWDNTLETYPELAENSDNFMQEVIANIGETAPNNTIFRQIIGYIKQFLSKLGYGWDINKITADDIRDMVQHSVRVALRGETTEARSDLSMAAEEAGALRPTYYSQLTRVITNAQFKNNVSTQSGEQWANWLNSKTSEAGVKRDELEFSGLLEFLELNPTEKFNKQDILNYLNDNGTKVNEYMYGEGEGTSYSDKDRDEWVEQGVSEYVESHQDNISQLAYEEAADTYDFPYYVKEEDVTDAEGNKVWRVYFEGQRTAVDDTYYFTEDQAQEIADEENNRGVNDYAEQLYDRALSELYSNAENVREELTDQWDEDHANVRTRYLDWTMEGGDKKYTEVVIALQNPKKGTVFSHQHWPDISNPIAHYRVNARTDIKGNNVLFVEEIQSDWAQAPKKLRKKHIIELAEKFKVDPKQIAKFVPGDWGFKRKFTPEQEKEYDNLINKLYEFKDARNQLSGQISKLIEFEKKLYAYIDYEVRKVIGPRDANEVEYDMTRTDYLADVVNRNVKERTTSSGYKVDTKVVKAILNQPGLQENLDQYEKNKLAKNKLLYKEEQLVEKINDLEFKKQALSQSGKIDKGPFVQDTEAWSNLVLKNIIRFAAERGYDKVAFVNGKQAAFKGGKAEYIDEVFGTRNADNTFTIYATLKDGGGKTRTLENIRDLDLEDYVGGLADKFRGLKVGETDGYDAGELKLPSKGMVEFYDGMILRYAAKLIKKLGGTQLEKIELIPPSQDRPEDEKVGIQRGFTVTSAMKDKAMAGQPLFARASKKELDEDLKKSGTVGKEEKGFPTLGERFIAAPLQTVDELIADFRKSFFSFDAAQNNKMIRVARQDKLPETEIAKMIQASRVSQAVKADQLADMWMVHGGMEYDPESFSFFIKDLANSMSTIRDDLKALAKKRGVSEYEMYQYGNAAFVSARSADLIRHNNRLYRRVVKLLADGKTAQAKKEADKYKLVHQTPAEIKRGLKFFTTIPELKKIKNVWNINRSRLMDIAVENGLYTREKADELLDIIDYVPFFRDKQIEARKALNEFPRGLLDAAQAKRLKGSYQPVNNVFDNMERWARYTIKKSINNKAAQEKIKYYSKIIPDDIKIVKAGRSVTGNTVAVWQEGKVVKYEFQGYDGESMVDGFTGMEPATMAPGAAFTRPFNEFLRAQIVLEPLFNLAQIPMDLFNAMFSSGVNVGLAIPLQVMKEIVFTPLGISSARKYLTARGITGKRDFNSEYDRIDINAMKEVKELSKTGKLIEYILAPPKALLKGAKFLGMASDNVIRQAVFSQIMLETGNKARATYAADEIINFRRTGSSSAINLVRQNAIFVNANLQAMNIAYGTIMFSDITNDRKLVQVRRLLLNGAQVIMAGLAIVAINADDDDYKKLDPKDRDNSIVIPGTGGYKLPLRGDILTLLFKILPEHLYNRYIEESEDSEKMKKALSVAFKRALATPSALPSYLTFFIEQSLNFDFVTGRPLKGRSQEDLEADLQYSNKYTSQFARAVTDLTKDTWYEVTPIGVQHFMNRWLASTSMLVGLFTNSIIANMRGEILPTQTIREKLLQIPNMGKFLSKEENTRNINDFYELSQLVDAAVQSANKYKSNDMEKYKEFLNKDNKLALISLRKELANIRRDLSNIREYENKIYASRDTGKWTPQTKKNELMRLEAVRQKMLGHEVQVKDGIDRRIQNMRKQGGL